MCIPTSEAPNHLIYLIDFFMDLPIRSSGVFYPFWENLGVQFTLELPLSLEIKLVNFPLTLYDKCTTGKRVS